MKARYASVVAATLVCVFALYVYGSPFLWA